MDKKQLLKKLSEELSAEHVYDEYIKDVSSLNTDNVRLGIMGQPNTAKTTLINGLLGTKLPVSNLPSQTNYTINYGKVSEDSLVQENKGTEIVVDSDWLKNHNLSILEINNDIVPDETSPMELCSIISKCDVCIYLINAQSALNRTDLFILNNLKDINMSTILVLSRLDLLSEEDQNEVYTYVKSNISEFTNVSLPLLSDSISKSASVIKDEVDKSLSKVNVKAIRSNFDNFYLTIAIGQLYEICQAHIDECNEKKHSIEQLATDKMLKLDEKSTQWLSVESKFRQRISVISDKLRTFMTDRKDDMLRRLSHDVDVCGDVKLFWEKDFPFRLEEMVRSEMGSATQLVNQELVKTIQWLQDELLKQFRCKISLTTGIVNERGKSTIQNADEVPIADIQKLKIVTRIGTAATVIAAGALFATSGIGGIIMAVSMVSGLGAEFFMRKQSNDSKEQIKKHLPDIIERANLQIVTDYESKIHEVTAELISHLQTLKSDWMESSKKTIEQEKAIAIFNFGSAKWDSIMARINQLSEILIK